VAVVGTGRLGGFHAQKLARFPDAELVAVVDPVASRRDRVAAECRTQSLADCGPLLGQIDAAVVAVPTRFHHPVAMELLRWGIHLLVEKPLCATAAEADDLVRAAQRNGAVLQVGHVERFNPAVTAALPHLADPKYIEAVRASGFAFRSTDIGAVLDLMIHDLDLVLALVRSPLRRIEALGLSVLGGHEDVANARLEFESGCVASLSASRVNHEQVRRLNIWSAKGFAGIDFAARKTTLVRPSDTLLRRELDVDALAADATQDRQRILGEHLRREVTQFDAVDALALELEDFLASIRQQRRPRVSGEDGRDAVVLAERILRKIQTHAWDNRADGPVGPLAIPHPATIPAPHFALGASPPPARRREAG
jgi:predicted dehydrogenase